MLSCTYLSTLLCNIHHQTRSHLWSFYSSEINRHYSGDITPLRIEPHVCTGKRRLFSRNQRCPPNMLVIFHIIVNKDQAAFLNCVVLLEIYASSTSSRDPSTLLRKLQEIEQRIGRQKSFRNGPRLIDVDILCITQGARPIPISIANDCSSVPWQNIQVNISSSGAVPALFVPHPRIEERAFVLRPLVNSSVAIINCTPMFLIFAFLFK